jgi:hypothetical protein
MKLVTHISILLSARLEGLQKFVRNYILSMAGLHCDQDLVIRNFQSTGNDLSLCLNPIRNMIWVPMVFRVVI